MGVERDDRPVRFVADRMLGKLARYLRLLGYDVLYPAACEDAALIALARREGRVLLTRDRELAGIAERRHGHPIVVKIRPQDALAQLRQLTSEGWIGRAHDPRCPLCNGALGEMGIHEARHLVPPYTLATQASFLSCPRCNLVLWEGSHWLFFRGSVRLRDGNREKGTTRGGMVSSEGGPSASPRGPA